MKDKHIFLVLKKRKSPLWSEEEDEIIRQNINLKQKNKWNIISLKLKNKTATQAYLRSKLIDPNLKKGKFSIEEDQKLRQLVDFFGPSWRFIAKLFNNRNSKQLRLRYNNHLNEKFSKRKISTVEDRKILSLFQIYGKQWKKYKEHFPDRSYIKIKLRYKSLIKIQKKVDSKKGNKIIKRDIEKSEAEKYSIHLEKSKIAPKLEKLSTTQVSNQDTLFSINNVSLNENKNNFFQNFKNESNLKQKISKSYKNSNNLCEEEVILENEIIF